jgi:hypothetical protein
MPTSYFKKLSVWLKSNFWDITLILIILGASIFVAVRNFTPGTWLLGWDDLVPELNFKLNIARSFSAAWQEYQGLGLLGGMAHAADLPRQIILWVSSLVLPISFLRYFWAYLMLAVGPIGVFILVSRGVLSKASSFVTRMAGLSSAIFYLFNLATVQIFYTPFETFLTFYGFFPWLLFLSLEYLKNGGRKKLLTFFVVSFLASGAFYVQTLFVVYIIFLVVFALESIVKFGKTGIIRSFKLGITTLFVNAFWLLPVIYFGLTGASIPGASHINSIATPETQMMNQARTNFTDIATLKGYWFDYYDWDLLGNHDLLYKNWISYSGQLTVTGVSISLFVVSVLGLLFSVIKKKMAFGASFLVLLGISYGMLNGGNVPGIPYFSEMFRNAFTKWSNATALVYAVGIGFFVFITSDLIKNWAKYFIGIVVSVGVIAGSVFSVLPVVNGNLISESMKVDMPSYYLDAIGYFKSQDSTKRIASFPLTDLWGWKYNDWGYRGSGFMWYGISQPILDRAFDVWSPYNEAFYSEVSHAVTTKNYDEFGYVLAKYQVSYILFDGSIYEPGKTDSAVNLENQRIFLESSPILTRAKVFGKLIVYEVNSNSIYSFVSAPRKDYDSEFFVMGQKGDITVKEIFPDTQGYVGAKNCNIKGEGSVEKEKMSGGNYYKAENGGVSCDYFYYSTLDYSQAYEMRLTGRNISGRSLKFYLYNIKNKNVEKEELLPTGDFDKLYLVLPSESSPSARMGYTLSVETRSFGKIDSENLLTGVEFYPVEYRKIDEPAPITNKLVINNVRKYGTWGYKVDVQGYGLIQLGQGYDEGWLGVTKVGPNWTKLEHLKVNSWANGWVVPTIQPFNHSTIYLIFWPQALEWGGMILGVVTLLFLASKKRD